MWWGGRGRAAQPMRDTLTGGDLKGEVTRRCGGVGVRCGEEEVWWRAATETGSGGLTVTESFGTVARKTCMLMGLSLRKFDPFSDLGKTVEPANEHP